jgi:dipeptidyl aminopeptidase/acylaminoacyl peptidase
MANPSIAPYGHWESPISLDAVAYGSVAVSAPRHSPKAGRSFFVESKKDGKKTFMEITKDGSAVEFLPDGYSVVNSVYEYGASLYDVLADGRLIFSNKDGSVCLLDPDTKTVTTLIKTNSILRYASFSASNGNSPWALAIEEDHTDDTPAGVKTYIVAIHTGTGQAKRIVSGADFYYTPRFSPDGSRVSWLTWNHPDMMFDPCTLYWAMWNDEDASLGQANFVAGGKDSSVAEPRWSADNTLFYCEETQPYRRMFRLTPGGKEAQLISIPSLEKAELGEISLAEGR